MQNVAVAIGQQRPPELARDAATALAPFVEATIEHSTPRKRVGALADTTRPAGSQTEDKETCPNFGSRWGEEGSRHCLAPRPRRRARRRLPGADGEEGTRRRRRRRTDSREGYMCSGRHSLLDGRRDVPIEG